MIFAFFIGKTAGTSVAALGMGMETEDVDRIRLADGPDTGRHTLAFTGRVWYCTIFTYTSIDLFVRSFHYSRGALFVP